jgi:hypothetical protein
MLGEALGLEWPDLFKELKVMRGVDHDLGEEPLPLGQPATWT